LTGQKWREPLGQRVRQSRRKSRPFVLDNSFDAQALALGLQRDGPVAIAAIVPEPTVGAVEGGGETAFITPDLLTLAVAVVVPERTSADAFSGFSGLTVVCACRNGRTPATLKPMANTSSATSTRTETARSRPGIYRAASHIGSPNNAVTIGGGILFSSARIKTPD
jgi:hypothetical protein